MAANLPALCLDRILEFVELGAPLAASRAPTIHACALVNRHWCKAVVPALWKDPFSLVIGRPLNSAQNLVDAYLSFLPHDEKETLRAVMELPGDQRDGDPTFDYFSFLRVFCLESLMRAIGAMTNDDWDGLRCRLVVKSLCRSFIRRSPAILQARFALDADDCLHKWGNNLWVLQSLDMFAYAGSERSFARLRTLHVSSQMQPWTLRSAALVASNIECLHVCLHGFDAEDDIDGWLDALVRLIHAQRCLRKFTLLMEPAINPDLTRVLDALATCERTLRHVKFIDVDFMDYPLFDTLSRCVSLETVSLSRCGNINDLVDVDVDQDCAAFRRLNTLDITKSFVPLAPMLEIFRCANRSLRSLIFSGLFPAEDALPQFVGALSTHCTALVDLRVVINSTAIPTLIHSLDRWPSLERLAIDDGRRVKHDFENVDDLLPVFGQGIAPTLRSLDVRANWTVSPEALKQFLVNCRANIEVISLERCECISEEHIDQIVEHAQGALQYLDIARGGRMSEEGRACLQIGFARRSSRVKVV